MPLAWWDNSNQWSWFSSFHSWKFSALFCRPKMPISKQYFLLMTTLNTQQPQHLSAFFLIKWPGWTTTSPLLGIFSISWLFVIILSCSLTTFHQPVSTRTEYVSTGLTTAMSEKVKVLGDHFISSTVSRRLLQIHQNKCYNRASCHWVPCN